MINFYLGGYLSDRMMEKTAGAKALVIAFSQVLFKRINAKKIKRIQVGMNGYNFRELHVQLLYPLHDYFVLILLLIFYLNLRFKIL